MSVVFEGVEVPTACCFVDGEHSAFAHFEYCRFYNVCKQRETIKANYKPSDCPVKALEQEPCEDATLKDIFCMGCEYKEPTKNDLGVDCTSKQAVLNNLLERLKDYKTKKPYITHISIDDLISALQMAKEQKGDNV